MLTKSQCQKFFQNESVNPLTNRKIKIGGPTHKRLMKMSKKVFVTSKEVFATSKEVFVTASRGPDRLFATTKKLKKSKDLILQRFLQKHEDIEVLSFIARGAAGSVYNCIYKGKNVVLKLFKSHTKAFQRDLNSLKKLQGNNYIPRLYTFGNNYYVIEKLDGTLQELVLLQKNVLTAKQCNQIYNIAGDLVSQGIDHGDFFATNIMYKKTLKSIKFYVIDFDKAKVVKKSQELLILIKNLNYLLTYDGCRSLRKVTTSRLNVLFKRLLDQMSSVQRNKFLGPDNIQNVVRTQINKKINK
jgi:predicted Ser/Thr protein kinase